MIFTEKPERIRVMFTPFRDGRYGSGQKDGTQRWHSTVG